MSSYRIVETPTFNRALKKLHANQKIDLFAAIRIIADDPALGELKVGNLAGIRVYKFSMLKQQQLLAYEIEEAEQRIKLLDFGSHENFYRDLKR